MWLRTCHKGGFLLKIAKCKRCKKIKEVGDHHILPKTYGGTNDKSNRISLCKECHNTVEELTDDLLKQKNFGIRELKTFVLNGFPNEETDIISQENQINIINGKNHPVEKRFKKKWKKRIKLSPELARNKENALKKAKEPKNEVICLNCKKPFKTNTKWAKFCNASCRINYWRERKQANMKSKKHNQPVLTPEEQEILAQNYYKL